MAEMRPSFPRSWTTRRSRGSLALVVIACCSLLLTACGGGDDPPADATEEATAPVATPSPTPSPVLGQVVFSQSLGSDGQPVDPSAEISRSATTIVAAVEVQDVQPGTSYTASWSMDGNPIPELDASTTLEGGAVDGWVSFTLTWEGAALWPVCQLDVTITASSGGSVQGSVLITST